MHQLLNMLRNLVTLRLNAFIRFTDCTQRRNTKFQKVFALKFPEEVTYDFSSPDDYATRITIPGGSGWKYPEHFHFQLASCEKLRCVGSGKMQIIREVSPTFPQRALITLDSTSAVAVRTGQRISWESAEMYPDNCVLEIDFLC